MLVGHAEPIFLPQPIHIFLHYVGKFYLLLSYYHGWHKNALMSLILCIQLVFLIFFCFVSLFSHRRNFRKTQKHLYSLWFTWQLNGWVLDSLTKKTDFVCVRPIWTVVFYVIYNVIYNVSFMCLRVWWKFI